MSRLDDSADLFEPEPERDCLWCGLGRGEFGHSRDMMEDCHPECLADFKASVWYDFHLELSAELAKENNDGQG